MDDLKSKRLLLVTGKGGVGRTSITAALATAAARKGSRVLVAEIGEPGEYSLLARLFGRDSFSDYPQAVAPNISGVVLWARRGHERFLKWVLPVPALARAGMRSDALRRLFDTAPSLYELGVFYHLLTLLRKRAPNGKPEFDLIVIDMPATGHTLALSGLPERVLALVPVGPVADVIREGEAIVQDPRQTSAWIVTLPETLPVTESLELLEGLRETRIPVGGVLVNKYVQDVFTAEEREVLTEMVNEANVFGGLRFKSVEEVKRSVERLNVEANVPLQIIPELPQTEKDLIQAIADVLLASEAS